MNYGNNIGRLGDNPGGTSSIYTPVKHTQVYYATHKNDGLRDSFMNRSFISFSFGGKLIEDFNLLATIDGDRLTKQLHANFNDLTSEYEVVNGQFYWGTYFSNNQIEFNLATDGITQNQLDDFKNWFAPGQTRELVLSEHPNRAIMARISQPPVMNIIPFEEKTTVMINTNEYETSTTLYKGEIELSFTMDSPFWYSRTNLLTKVGSLNEFISLLESTGTILNQDTSTLNTVRITYQGKNSSTPRIITLQTENNQTMWVDAWTDANDSLVSVYDDKDALKVILEDGVPTLSMLRDPIFLGNGLVFQYNEDNARVDYAIVDSSHLGSTKTGISMIGDSINLNAGEAAYLYYSGTAPEKPLIEFDVDRAENINSGGSNNGWKIVTFSSDITKEYYSTDNFDQINFSGKDEIASLDIKAPILYNDYNIARELFHNFYNIENIRKEGNQKLTHPALRKWFFKILDYYDKINTGRYIVNLESKLMKALSYFILTSGFVFYYSPHHFSFNFETGQMLGTFTYRTITEDTEITDFDDFETLGTLTTVTEDVSDMILSTPILNERNSFSKDGTVKYGIEDNTLLSYEVANATPSNLLNLSITYQNKYY